jgi:hypothetical protein
MTKKNQERGDSDADDHAAGGGVLADEVFTEAVCHHDIEPSAQGRGQPTGVDGHVVWR